MSEKDGARAADPRVLRSRAAAVEAATSLFLENGYDGTTMDEIAERAGLTKRTLYNNYEDKAALFTEAVDDVITFAEEFANELGEAFFDRVANDPSAALNELGRRLALAIMRPPVIALRRLLISEAEKFPHLAQKYFDSTPGRVLDALTAGFEQLHDTGRLRVEDPRIAAEQFAYLVVGATLDRAVLVGTLPPEEDVLVRAEAGVRTFLAGYGIDEPGERLGTEPSGGRET